MARFPKVVGLAVFFLAQVAGGTPPAQLSLAEYLDQVRVNNLGVRSAKEASQGANERGREADLLYAPSLFAEASYLNDRKPTLNPNVYGIQTVGSLYKLGVSQQTSFGMRARLTTEVDYVSVRGASSQALPTP